MARTESVQRGGIVAALKADVLAAALEGGAR